jgi:hypothetical protein
MASATSLTAQSIQAQGRGEINLINAMSIHPINAPRNFARSTGTGSLDAAGDVDVAGQGVEGQGLKSDAWAWDLS